MDAKTERALRESIRKWKGVVLGNPEKGASDCALCHIYNNIQHECKGCPVFNATGRAHCVGTPYSEWVNVASRNDENFRHTGSNPNALQAAIKMRDFLKSLLPSEPKMDQLGELVLPRDARADRDVLVAALHSIAAWDDAGANLHLKTTGSYGCFDEPGSVKMAREALAKLNIFGPPTTSISMPPVATHFTTKEGGTWFPWKPFDQYPHTAPINVFAVKFADDWIWDTKVGWRAPR